MLACSTVNGLLSARRVLNRNKKTMENIRQCLTIIATVALMQFQSSSCFEWSPSSPAEGTIVQACLVEKVSFPWAFSTAASETVINIEWHKVTETTDKMIATETGGFFFKTPVVPMTVEFLPNAGITLSNFTLNDLGTYRVTVNFKRSGSFFSQSRSAVLALPDSPIISGDRLVAHVQAEPVTDVITGERHIDLTCGAFLELGSRPVSVDWRTPSGETVPSTSFSHGEFHLTLPNPVVGGSYVCRLKDPSFAARCVKNMSALRRGAHVLVDGVQTRLLLLEDGVQGLQDKDQAVDDELEQLEEKDANLTSRDDQLQEELLQLGEADDKIQSEVDHLRADVSSDVNDLQHKVSLREEADDTLASDLTDLQGKVSALEKRNTLEDKLASDLATLQEEQVQIKKKTSELEDLLKKVETRLTSAFEGLEENISKPVHRSCRAAGWIGFQASCYKLVKEKVSWSTAKNRCKSLGGKLAEIESSEENTFVKGLAQQAGFHTWLGGSDLKSEGTWKWESSGNDIQFRDWESGQPDDSGNGEDCLHLWNTRSYRWNDASCQYGMYFVCEMSVE